MIAAPGAAAAEKRPWGWAALALCLLGPFFFASYGFATWRTAQLAEVGAVVFAWERAIPLWPWTIVPYWSIDLLYGLSLFLCRTRAELQVHALRLLTAQLISIAFFLIYPLRFTLARPPIDGFFGLLFTALGQFDKPFNQAPSLHISLLVILWVRFAAHLGSKGRLVLHLWFTLIGLSVLTTWQHHFIDLPTGFAAGAFCLALWPERPGVRQRDPRRFLLAALYTLGAALCGVAAQALRTLDPAFLWLWWPAAALGLVALAYLTGQPATFGKGWGQWQGRLPWPLATVLAPYLLGAWLNSRLWTRRHPQPVEVLPGLWLGRLPDRGPTPHFAALVDCLAELPIDPHGACYQVVPMLDLLAPEPAQLEAAADAITRAREHGPTLVYCALGYSRSAASLAAYLLTSGQAADADAAIAKVAAAQPRLVLGERLRESLRQQARG